MLADRQLIRRIMVSVRDGDEMAIEEAVTRLRVAVLLLARRLRTTSAEEGLTPTQYGVLATLERDGPLRAGDLAETEALNPTMLSRVLGHLEERGLAARSADAEDRRATWARSTASGRRLVRRLRRRRSALLLERMDRLDEADLHALLAALPALEALAGSRAPAAVGAGGEPA
jgi:DNA-binding MarR family transcriptional regulator